MSSLRTLMFVLCTSWYIFEETSAENSYSCGVTDFKLDEIDEDHREIKFKWRGYNGYYKGEMYYLECAIFESHFDTYTQLLCENSDALPKTKEIYRYMIPDQDYFCAVITYNFKRSKILKVTTPGNHFTRAVTIAVPIVIVICIVASITGVFYYRRRRIPVVGLVVRDQSRTQPATTVNLIYPPTNGLIHPPPCRSDPVQHPAPVTSEGQHPSAPQQPDMQQNYYSTPYPNQWGNPPPYHVANDNPSFPKSCPGKTCIIKKHDM